MTLTNINYNIRKASEGDIPDLRDLYYNTITKVNSQDYDQDQITAWAQTADNLDSLRQRIKQQYFLICYDLNERIVGFVSLEDSYLDLLYVHYQYQHRGVGSLLIQNILQFARQNRQIEITTEASITAKPFFESQGFQVLKEQQIQINSVFLKNYLMNKEL